MLAGLSGRLEDPFLLQDLDDLALLVELGEAVGADEIVLLEGLLVLGLELAEEVFVDKVLVVAVRYFFSEKKGIFYYTADGRIDFRQLVKDLAKELRMRIEMRQVGVRDEAKLLGGLGVCGRALCCASFMRTFEPVTIQKARKQNIAINPTKISGLCGRLMCCLGFEEASRGRMYYDEDSAIED